MSDPYGTWSSPITAELVATGAVDLGHLALDGDDVYWLERRPDEGGRGVIGREEGDGFVALTPADVDVRTLVQEYGGGDFAVQDGVAYYVDRDDQRCYRMHADAAVAGTPDPVPITPDPRTEQGLRYADLEPAPESDLLYAVREDHDAVAGADDRDDADVAEPVTTLVAIPADGDGQPAVVARGHDFYAAPRLSPDGDHLAWLTWDHPGMPWDGTTLHVADVAPDGSLDGEHVVLGGPEESVFAPAWSPEGTLHAVSDRSGKWRLYRLPGATTPDAGPVDPEPVSPGEGEYGVPQWVFGLSTYAFLEDGRVAALVVDEGTERLELLDGAAKQEADGQDGGSRSDDHGRTVADLPYASFWPPRLRSVGEALVFEASGPRAPGGVVRWRPGGEPTVVRRRAARDVPDDVLAAPEHVAYETRDGERSRMYVYPPTNPGAEPPGEERPPLVVYVHGGPTSRTTAGFALGVQYFTSRRFAVADVNYRGSTGHGRAYREALFGRWGEVDVTDTVDAARHLAEASRVDPDRMAVRGGSAGGFVVLAALAFHDTFDAGTSYYGVADLARLAELTHKFESRYLDRLVGPYPEVADRYRERSPLFAADQIDAPLLLLQGSEDPVVPLSQAQRMADALADSGVPHDLVVFEGEDHGFDGADARRRAREAELAFYGRAFGFEPADDLPAVDLD